MRILDGFEYSWVNALGVLRLLDKIRVMNVTGRVVLRHEERIHVPELRLDDWAAHFLKPEERELLLDVVKERGIVMLFSGVYFFPCNGNVVFLQLGLAPQSGLYEFRRYIRYFPSKILPRFLHQVLPFLFGKISREKHLKVESAGFARFCDACQRVLELKLAGLHCKAEPAVPYLYPAVALGPLHSDRKVESAGFARFCDACQRVLELKLAGLHCKAEPAVPYLYPAVALGPLHCNGEVFHLLRLGHGYGAFGQGVGQPFLWQSLLKILLPFVGKLVHCYHLNAGGFKICSVWFLSCLSTVPTVPTFLSVALDEVYGPFRHALLYELPAHKLFFRHVASLIVP